MSLLGSFGMSAARTLFSFDGTLNEDKQYTIAFEGYDSGLTWNGWAVPLFTKSVMQEAAKWISAQPESPQFRIAQNGDLLERALGEEKWERVARPVWREDVGESVYVVDLGLTWSVVSPDELASDAEIYR